MEKNSFTLIEAVISIFFLIMGIITVSGVISYVFLPYSISAQKLVAAHLAQEGIEIIRNIRDTNYLERIGNFAVAWDEGLVNCSVGCEVDYTMVSQPSPLLPLFGSGRYLCIDNAGFYGYNNCSLSTTFKRKITITPQVNMLEIKVEVSWEERGKVHKLEIKENLYHYW